MPDPIEMRAAHFRPHTVHVFLLTQGYRRIYQSKGWWRYQISDPTPEQQGLYGFDLPTDTSSPNYAWNMKRMMQQVAWKVGVPLEYVCQALEFRHAWITDEVMREAGIIDATRSTRTR